MEMHILQTRKMKTMKVKKFLLPVNGTVLLADYGF